MYYDNENVYECYVCVYFDFENTSLKRLRDLKHFYRKPTTAMQTNAMTARNA